MTILPTVPAHMYHVMNIYMCKIIGCTCVLRAELLLLTVDAVVVSVKTLFRPGMIML